MEIVLEAPAITIAPLASAEVGAQLNAMYASSAHKRILRRPFTARLKRNVPALPVWQPLGIGVFADRYRSSVLIPSRLARASWSCPQVVRSRFAQILCEISIALIPPHGRLLMR